MSETITIRAADGTRAVIATTGSEPISWQVGGREYLWNGDPAHWNRHAPWLFPVVGASVDATVRVAGRPYPMAQHGFARDASFTVVARAEDAVTLRLAESDETRRHYPFAFRLDITARVAPAGLAFEITIENPGPASLPYALGFHPAFPWPFAGGERREGVGYGIAFEQSERASVPEIGEGGVILDQERPIPLKGTRLPLAPELFKEALVFLNARSRAMRFVAPDGTAIAMRVEDFPHLAVWTKPAAPFLSLECWTGHADRAGFSGELSQRDSQRLLPPGASARHAVALTLER